MTGRNMDLLLARMNPFSIRCRLAFSGGVIESVNPLPRRVIQQSWGTRISRRPNPEVEAATTVVWLEVADVAGYSSPRSPTAEENGAFRAVPVVADEGDVAQVQFGEELGDEGGERWQGEVGVVGHRRGVRAERQLRDDAAVAIPQAVGPWRCIPRPPCCWASSPRSFDAVSWGTVPIFVSVRRGCPRPRRRAGIPGIGANSERIERGERIAA